MNKRVAGEKIVYSALVGLIFFICSLLFYPRAIGADYAGTSAMPPSDNVSFNYKEAKNFVFEKGDTLPEPGNQGRLFFNTAKKALYADSGEQFYDLNGEIKNVKAFGAIGDGTTQDRNAIQAAIDNLGPSGGIVYFPPGEYRIDSPIVVPDDKYVILQGNNEASVIRGALPFTGDAIIKNSGIGTKGPVVRYLSVTGHSSLSNVNAIKFSNLSTPIFSDAIIDMQSAANSDAIAWENVKQGRMNRLVIEDVDGAGIHLGDSVIECIVSDVRLGNDAKPVDIGLKLVGASDCFIDLVTINNVSGTGVWMEGTRSNTLISVSAHGNPAAAFHVEGDENSYLHHCTFDNSAGVALEIIGSNGSFFTSALLNGAVNIDSACRLLKFEHARESDNVVISDNSPDSYWDAVKDDDLHFDIKRQSPALGRFVSGGTNAKIFSGPGNPEGAVSAWPGSMYLRTDGGAGATLYIKQSGNGTNTGWASK